MQKEYKATVSDFCPNRYVLSANEDAFLLKASARFP
jgi:hypothetical protein